MWREVPHCCNHSLLDMMEEKGEVVLFCFYRYVREHSQRQAHLGERIHSSHDPELCEEIRQGKEKGEWGQMQQPKEWRSKMVGLYREEQPKPPGWKVRGRVLGWDVQARRTLKHAETEECWEKFVTNNMWLSHLSHTVLSWGQWTLPSGPPDLEFKVKNQDNVGSLGDLMGTGVVGCFCFVSLISFLGERDSDREIRGW